MNENNENNSGVVRPYKATANLNTTIGNPSVNINNTMDVNIQNIATNTVVSDYSKNGNLSVSNNIQSSLSNKNDNIGENANIPNKIGLNNHNNFNNTNQNNMKETSYVTKTYVTVDNKPKKKKLALSLGSEFKVALLIIVILLVFVFMLPIISEMVFGY